MTTKKKSALMAGVLTTALLSFAAGAAEARQGGHSGGMSGKSTAAACRGNSGGMSGKSYGGGMSGKSYGGGMSGKSYGGGMSGKSYGGGPSGKFYGGGMSAKTYGGGPSAKPYAGGAGMTAKSYGSGPSHGYAKPRHGRHHHKHHRFFAFAPYGYDDSYGYGDGCYWLKNRAIYTGSDYWWNRYYNCLNGYGYE